METEARQFTPYDPTTKPTKLIAWLVIGGVAAVGAIVWMGRREPAPAKEKAQVASTANIAAPLADTRQIQQDAAKVVEQAKAVIAPLVRPADSGPNVIGANKAPAAVTASLVPAAEVERQRARAKKAEALEAKAQKEIANLRRANAELGQRLAAYQVANRPPPPSQSEQILETLAPALRPADER